MKRLGISSFLILPCLLLLCLSDTAFGQQPTLIFSDPNNSGNVIDPNHPLSYNVTSGNTTLQQVVLTASQATSVTFKVDNDPSTGQPWPWLKINSTSSGNVNLNLSTTMVIQVTTQGLPTGAYHGSFSVGITGQLPSQTIGVNLTVNGGSVLSSNIAGNQIPFTAIVGSNTSSPTSVPVQINSTIGALNYNITSSYTGQTLSWLLLSTTSGVTGGAGFTVSVNPTGLVAGTYNATITVTASTNDQLNINVSLSVGTTGTLTVSPANPPPFLYQLGGATPQSQTITVSSATAINFSINTNASWLNPSQLAGFAGPNQDFQFQLNVQTAGLQIGTTNATLTLQPSGGTPQTIPFSIVVSANPLLLVSPTTLSFQAAFAGSSPTDQTVNITTTGAGSALGFTVTSDSSWLSGSTSNFQNITPASLIVHVTQGNLAVGNYVGILTVRPTNGDNYSIHITVNLAVGTSQQLTAGPPALLFSYQTTRSLPPAQVLTVSSTGQPVSFTVGATVSTCTGNSWLFPQASQLTTPATVTVSVNAPGPTSGTCTGVVTVTPSSGNALQIPVSVTIAATPLFTISMPNGFGYETVQQGSGSGVSRQIAVNSTDNTPLQFSVAASTSTGSGNWLAVGGGGTTPQTLNVFFLPSGLNAGVYTGNIVITSATLPGGSFTIPVQLTVTPNVNITVAPSQLSFTASQNGPIPATQTLSLTNTGGTPGFTATISQNCQSLIGLDRSSGVASGNITVSVLSTTGSVGTFNCQISLVYTGSANNGATVPVTVTISNPRTLSAAPPSLAFAYQLSQPQPATQKITLSSTGGAVQFTVSVNSSPWLFVDTTSATTPKDIVVSVNTTGLTVANSPYTGQISITAPGVLANPLLIPVTLTVTAAPTPQPVTITSAATFLAGTIAPGELITIKGTLLGPTTAGGVSFSLNSSGGVNSTLAGVRVLFDGIPGTPTYVSAGQINVTVPYEIAGRLSTNIVVEYQGIQSAPVGVRIADSAPGLFTLNQTGSGQIAAVNQNGTFNGPAGGGTIPASVGTTVSLYGTGGGQTSPPGQTGTVTPVPQTLSQLMRIPGIVSATVGGAAVRVDYAGQAPSFITGITQFNLFLSPGTPTGNQPVVITINGISSPLGATIAVQ